MMDKLVQDSLSLLRRMVATPSLSFEEAEVCSLISATLDGWGVEHRRIGDNIVAANLSGGEGAPVLVMDAHMDTVPAAGSYTRDPFDPGTDEDVIWGLGSNDDGGSVVSMIAAYRHFLDVKAPVNLILNLSCEEERSGPDGSALIFGPDGPFAKGELPTPDSVIVGEPTGMKAATSERGLLVLDGEAVGVSGHAARGEGVNALYIALEDIKALRDHTFVKHSPVMGDVRLTVTQINAGTAHNVVPDDCRFVVDVRPTDKYDNAELAEELQALCKSRLTPRNLKNKSSATQDGSPLLATVRKLGIETFSSPTTSDWIRIHHDALKMGPGDSSRSHKADEYILVSEIEEAVAKYIEFIETYYGNTVE